MTQTLTKRQLLYASAAGLSALAAGAALALRFGRKKPPAPSQASAIDALWAMTLQTPTDAPLTLAHYRGKPLLINFWATWCPPCVEEMPRLNQFYQQKFTSADNRIQLLGIAVDKVPSVVKFLNITPIQFPIALAGLEGMVVSKSLGNASGGLPYSVLISRNSEILFTKDGKLTANDLKTIVKLVGVT